ncbi:GNAT family N-acetyltransferase [Actinoplanes sp. NPDC051633]|uniref:GNAT family N-acetyltransferase n=1 Tax=Actinoplanes sp. NPDC051633 TaxID=3155670 RepID=UPI00342A7D0C
MHIETRPPRAADRTAIEAIAAADDARAPSLDDPLTLIAEHGGQVVGFGRIDWWEEADGTRLYRLSGAVDAAHKRQGVGRRLLAAQEAQAAAHWRAEPGPGRPLLGTNADASRPDRLALLHDAGYRVRFSLVDLARDTAGAEDRPLPEGLELRPVEEEHHPLIHAAIVTCFARHGLGFSAQSYADYRAEARDTDLWLVAWDDEGIAALATNERRADGSADTPYVAVLPRRRRQGLAQVLLHRSLRRLAAEGIRTATIRTTQENQDRTVELYEKCGYRVTGRIPRYAKRMELLGGDEPAGEH